MYKFQDRLCGGQGCVASLLRGRGEERTQGRRQASRSCSLAPLHPNYLGVVTGARERCSSESRVDLHPSLEQFPLYSALSVGLHPKVCKEELKFCAVSRREAETMQEPNAKGPETDRKEGRAPSCENHAEKPRKNQRKNEDQSNIENKNNEAHGSPSWQPVSPGLGFPGWIETTLL